MGAVLDRITPFTQTLLPGLAGRILEKMAQGEDFERIYISVDEMGRFL